MIYKSKTQPFCRYCGKAIKKWTETTHFGHWAAGTPRADIQPKSKQEAQRHVNGKIVSVDWKMKPKDPENWRGEQVRDYIDTVGTWDGESYADRWFHSGACAQNFAYAVLRSQAYAQIGMPDYHEAVKEARAKGAKP